MNRILIVSLFLLFAYTANAQSDSVPPARKYSIKSGKIIYQIKGGSIDGERIFIFDDWGNRTKQITTSHIDYAEIKKSLGIKDSTNSPSISKERKELIITTPAGIYHIDLDKKLGKFDDYHDSFLTPTNDYSKTIAHEVYLGRLCEVKNTLNLAKIWIWKGIMLKNAMIEKEGETGGSEYAVEIDEGYQIKPDEFNVPKDIRIECISSENN
jgi:hypothetical protein